METMTVTISDITSVMTVDDVIRMILKDEVVMDMKEYVLFYVKGNKEKRVKSTGHLHHVLADSRDSLVMTVKRRLKSKPKRSTVYKAKKTLMRLKNMFAREATGRQNNLNFTTTKNLDKGGVDISKCGGDKLTAIENLLQSQTIVIHDDREAEVKGKVELFRRFMNDINESINARPTHDTFVYTDNSLAPIGNSNDATGISSELNEAFMRLPGELSQCNNASVHGTALQDMDQDITELLLTDATDLFNECAIYEESIDMSEASESAFGDDEDVEDLERNVFDEDFEVSREDIRNLFDKSRAESTDDAIDSFMNTVARNEDHDEGLSSLGSDCMSQ